MLVGLLILFLGLAGLGSGYLAWMHWKEGGTGAWFFLAGALLCASLAAGLIMQGGASSRSGRVRDKGPRQGVGFVPHWFRVMVLVVMLVAVLLALIWR